MSGASTIFCPRPVAEPDMRLFVLHHAAGSHVTYRSWVDHFPPGWEVCLVEAPGRGRLSEEKLLDDPHALISRLFDDLLLWLDRPFAVFGHSMGGLLGYALMLRLSAAGLPLPCWLGLSGRAAPRLDGRPETQRHLLPAQELREIIGGLGGTPDNVLSDAELWAVVEPILRADLKVVETWRPPRGAQFPKVPLSVFGGEQDLIARPAQLAGWADLAPVFLGLHLFTGNHFYFTDQLTETTSLIVSEISKARTLHPIRH